MDFKSVQHKKRTFNKPYSSYEVNFNSTPLNLPPSAHKPSYTVDTLTDAEGLKRAYATDSGIFQHGSTLYISGTKSGRDVWDDISKIPFWGNSKDIKRYQDAKSYLEQHPEIDNVIGHSLGSSVGAELQKNYSQIKQSRFYGSPFLDFGSMVEKLTQRDYKTGQPLQKPERFADFFDPIAFFDKNAQKSFGFGLNPHSYKDTAKKFKNSLVIDQWGDMFPEDRIENYSGQEAGNSDLINDSNPAGRIAY